MILKPKYLNPHCDLANRCVWRVSADAQDLTAGGKNCSSLVSGLPGYPGALAMDPDGTPLFHIIPRICAERESTQSESIP